MATTNRDKKEVWFSGIDGVQHDHGIHAFVFGPDGKLYFNFGNEGKQLRDAKGKPIIDAAGNEVAQHKRPYQQGMIFRCDPDLSNLERSPELPQQLDGDGRLVRLNLAVGNDDDGNRAVRINYVMEFGNYGYRDEKPARAGARNESEWRTNSVASLASQRSGCCAQCSANRRRLSDCIAVYEGDALPAKFHGQLIHCDAGPSVTRAYLLSDDGAGYSAKIENILQGARDNWFRPSDVKVAPDGSLIVADWYDPGVGGHAMGDLDRGRLFVSREKGRGRLPRPEV